jgi:pyruvate/2-oxoglutarate dehydrogenase complex dihydrolipoamide dehydrogenase (E3) component
MKYDYDVVIIGVGSAGMVAAEVAANIGVKAAIVERDRIGGDCLWTGCVPSKTLMSSAKAAHTIRHAADYGLEPAELKVDLRAVWKRIRRVQDEIAATDDSADRFIELGVDVLTGEAAFAGPHRVRVGDRTVSTKYALVCTGSRPVAPPIEGLEEAGFLTTENFFQQNDIPQSLIVVGGGPIGVELAQALNRLGADITVLELMDTVLFRDDRTLTSILTEKLRSEGVNIHLETQVTAVERRDGRVFVSGAVSGDERTWEADDLIVITGRKPNLESLGLDAVDVKTSPKGIRVNSRMRTSAEWIYAAGDCAGRAVFTHTAAAEAAVAIRNMFFPGSTAAPKLTPWTTFTDPELAHVGMTAEEARRELGSDAVKTFECDLAHSDRARADGAIDGRMIVVTDKRFKILGAHILAPAAGEIISQFTLAITEGIRLSPGLTTTNVVQVYPTYSTSITQIAGEAIYGQLGSPVIQAARRLNQIFD